MSHILLIGAGDLGARVADYVLRREVAGELTLVDLPGGGGANTAEYLAASNTIPINFEGTNTKLH